MDSAKERRGHPRVAATVRVIVKPGGKQDSATIDTTTESLDISQGGLLFNSDISLEPETQVTVELLLEESLTMNANWPTIEKTFPEGIKMPASVVRSKGAPEIGYEIGVSFGKADQEKLAILQEFLSEIKQA